MSRPTILNRSPSSVARPMADRVGDMCVTHESHRAIEARSSGLKILGTEVKSSLQEFEAWQQSWDARHQEIESQLALLRFRIELLSNGPGPNLVVHQPEEEGGESV